ncbi:MAG: MATE family efflux transporter [Bacteroidetes bacterium]|nr:MAG: MATE family efflux transporter [Bacteroidota bacterium]
MGTSGFTAQAFGEKNNTEMIMMFGRSMFFAIIGGLMLIVLKYPIELFSFYLIDGSPEVETLAREYYNIRVLAAPASLGILALSGWFVGMQNARTPMYIAIAINVINIGANFIFVFGLGMKSNGVAWGTVIAQYSGLLFGLLLFRAKYRVFFRYWMKSDFFNWQKLGGFFKVNLDIIIRTLSLIFVFAFFTAQSAKTDDTILAVNTVLLQYLFVFAYLTDGFAYAAEALVGKFVGAGSLADLKTVIKKIFFWGFGFSIPFSIIYLFFGQSLLWLLTDNEKVIEAATPYLFWIGLVPIVTFAAFIWDGIYIGATSSVAMRNALLIATFIVFLPSYYLFREPLGNHGLWLSIMLFMIARGILLTLFRKRYIYSLVQD